jgi:hypothetical protein
MKPCILVIGGQDSGKSTIIASLCGCRRGFRGPVTDHTNGRQIYVVASSPQEARLESEELDEILDEVRSSRNIVGLVMAVQPTVARTRLRMEEIVRAAQDTGRMSIHAFILDPPYNGNGEVDVAVVRGRLTGMGVAARRLDARRFAFLNAARIRTIVGIP